MKMLVVSMTVLISLLFAASASAEEHQCDPDLFGITASGGALVRCKSAAKIGSNKIDWFAVDIRPHINVSPDRSNLHVQLAQVETIRQALISNRRLLIRFYPNNVENAYDCLQSNCRSIQDVFIIK